MVYNKYMKKKLISYILILAVALMGFGLDAAAASTKSVKKPVIKLSSPSANTLVVKTTSSAKHQGFQIRYSKSDSFKSYTSVKVKTSKALNKKFSSLTGDRIYYVKVRSYHGKKYSPWSKVKSIKVINLALDSLKDASSTDADTGDALPSINSELQVKIVTRALWIYEEGLIKSYDKSHTTYRISMGDDFHKSDCVNFVRFVINPIYGKAVVPFSSEEVWSYGKNCKEGYISVPIDKLEAGDMLCFNENPKDPKKRLDGVDHVALYLGNGKFIECTKHVSGLPNGGVTFGKMKGKNVTRFVGAVRYIEE